MPPKLKIGIGITAYNLPELTERLIASCVSYAGHDVTVYLSDHSQIPAVNDVCDRAAAGLILGRDGLPVNVVMKPTRRNVGLTVGWNDGLLGAYTTDPDNWADDSDRVCILVNDDCEFDVAPEPADPNRFVNTWDAEARIGWVHDGKGDVDRLAEIAHANRDKYAWTILGYNANYADTRPWTGIGWSCLAINPSMLRDVGMADENIAPIYYEDCDWGWRAQLAGLQMAELKQTRIVHYGSMSWKVDEKVQYQNTNQLSPARRALLRYISRKWNMEREENGFFVSNHGSQWYKHPFNNPSMSLYIDPSRRAKPYGVLYDRTDLKSVIKI
jgi:GT2 family glycosyltransferase